MTKELIQNLRSVGRLWEDEAADLIERLAIENENLLLANRDCLDHFNVMKDDLAAAQAQIKVMREALEEIKLRSVSLADAQVTALEALTQPTDDSALRKMLSKERERCAKVCEGYATGFPECSAKSFADAIRAMKDK